MGACATPVPFWINRGITAAAQPPGSRSPLSCFWRLSGNKYLESPAQFCQGNTADYVVVVQYFCQLLAPYWTLRGFAGTIGRLVMGTAIRGEAEPVLGLIAILRDRPNGGWGGLPRSE